MGKKIAVVGASGFVGRKLLEALLLDPDVEIKALSRSAPLISGGDSASNNALSPADPLRLQTVSCDLHNLKDTEDALAGQDVAIYLVHSMLPTTGLSQGNFADFDLILADNFARAARRSGISHVIYLSGLLPEGGQLSKHLESRKEVEETLRSYLPKVTILRCGLIVGPQGSSMTILINLVKRLPFMVCPDWTTHLCQTVSLEDVVKALVLVTQNSDLQGKTWDLGSKRATSYIEMLRLTAHQFGLRRRFLKVPIESVGFSKLWVRLISGAPKNLTYPLIESLRHSMLVRKTHEFPEQLITCEDFQESLKKIALAPQNTASIKPHAYGSSRLHQGPKLVRSIQRLPLPAGCDAAEVASLYLEFLPRLLPGLIGVRRKGEGIEFRVNGLGLVLLRLRYAAHRSQSDRQLFYVVGGILFRPGPFKARLEFREARPSEGKKVCLVAVHDFKPALPWFLYLCTQAQIHRIFMARFARFLSLK